MRLDRHHEHLVAMSESRNIDRTSISPEVEKGLGISQRKRSGSASASQASVANVGRENLSDAIAPHETYEGGHRYDPTATWTEAEERRVVRKTDFFLLTWLCVMVSTLPPQPATLSNINFSSLVCNLIVATLETP